MAITDFRRGRGAVVDLRDEFLTDLQRQIELASGKSADSAEVAWWTEVDGVIFLRLHFRGSVLKVNAEADTALLYAIEEVVGLLWGVRKSVLAGLLDERLLQLSVQSHA